MYCRAPFCILNAGRSTAIAVVLAMGCLAAGSAAGDEDESPGATAPDDLIAAGERATGAACASACHGWEVFMEFPRQTSLQWDFVITDMASRGADATEDQLELVRSFLKRVWGLVWINSASADELTAILGFSVDDAAAVIAWRAEHGRFIDLESLTAVPGIEAGAIDARAIMFD